MVLAGAGVPVGAGDLLGTVVITLGAAGMAVTGDLAGMVMVTGAVATGAVQDHIMLQPDQVIETTTMYGLLLPAPEVREIMTAQV